MNELYDIYTSLAHADGVLLYISFAIRFLLPLLALLILFRCGKSLLSDHPEDEIWGYLVDDAGNRLPLRHFENTIGSASSSDVTLDDDSVESVHAFLIRDGHGEWLLHPAKSDRYILCNGEAFDEPLPVFAGDRLTFGEVTLMFAPSTQEEEQRQAVSRTKPGGLIRPGFTMFLLTQFQLLLCCAHWISAMDELNLAIPICFGALITICWCYFFFMRALQRLGFEIEIMAFFLVTIGMSICATSTPGKLYEQAAFLIVGLLVFLTLGWFLRDLDRIKAIRLPVAVLGILFLGINLVLASRVFGARNWISIGGFSFQPSEFVKICFLFA
ncbi:MAG: FtsW/RodA/SpoVE family cell cycle protein, partial [Clostridia bacterium]|nr:FtsW/RodA/SpoVE family cell cycle protein [Clostridia bacterium]